MKTFLIIVAVLVVLFALILSISAELTLIYDGGWQTRVQVLFIKKDIELSKLLNFVLFPDKAGKEAAEKQKEKKENKEKQKDAAQENKSNESTQNKAKSNPIKKIIDNDGIVGVMVLASNLVETLNSAVITLFRGLHIHSLYVKMIIGGGDAADIGMEYGNICGMYYPLKGAILNGMKVDNYDDFIQADFIAPASEYELQLIASMSVGLVLKIAIKAGTVFLVNLIKNK